MDGIILDLDKDLTNEQIDTIIKKLQSKKKAEEVPKAVLTKAEKSLIEKIKKHVDAYYGGENRYSVEDFDAENYRKFVVGHIKEDMENMNSDLNSELDCCKENIEDSIDRIKEEQKELIGYKKEVVVWEKRIKQHKQAGELVKALMKEFAKHKE